MAKQNDQIGQFGPDDKGVFVVAKGPVRRLGLPGRPIQGTFRHSRYILRVACVTSIGVAQSDGVAQEVVQMSSAGMIGS
jgi:hypothetical protein